MELSLLVCPSCGAPLQPHAIKTVVVCKHCGASVARGVSLVKSARFRRAFEAAQKEIAATESDIAVVGRRYTLLGRVARGESADVFLARESLRNGSAVLLKILRNEADRDLVDRERVVLKSLATSRAKGTPYFTLLTPYVLGHGPASWRGAEIGEATVVRATSGFVHTIADVRAAFPSGADPRHAVWIFKRMLELLSWIHESGFVHGAILPQHVVLHVRGHGAMLVGFSCATRVGEKPIAIAPSHNQFYPDAVKSGAPLIPAVDLIMAARAVAYLVGASSSFSIPDSVPQPIAELLRWAGNAKPHDLKITAGEMLQKISEAADAAFGPPHFVELRMPSWNELEVDHGVR
ncbi:MAG: hypothetical protein ABI183_18285 [Polyangiaceae bacterium]